MSHVLVIDDSDVDRKRLKDLLTRDKVHSVAFARDAISAKSSLQEHSPDVVLFDAAMPNLDAVALVSEIRALAPGLPIVIVSSQGHEKLAIKVLQEGASSYVPKDVLADELLGTLRDVLEYSQQQTCHKRMLEQMVELQCKFVLENDRSLIPPLVNYIQEHVGRVGLCDPSEVMRIGIALDEALVNAIYHGNLELDSSLRENGNSYYRLAEQRAHQPPYCERRLNVEALISKDVAEIVIRDEGPGFDPNSLPDPRDPANLDKVSGRGVLLMRTFMDEVDYNSNGNRVRLRKYRQALSDPQAH